LPAKGTTHVGVEKKRKTSCRVPSEALGLLKNLGDDSWSGIAALGRAAGARLADVSEFIHRPASE
jgi:hypothetical protein